MDVEGFHESPRSDSGFVMAYNTAADDVHIVLSRRLRKPQETHRVRHCTSFDIINRHYKAVQVVLVKSFRRSV